MKDMRQEFADTLTEVGETDKNLVVMVGDISHFRLQNFAKICPDRYYNIGICEPTIINMAAGLSMLGFYPVMHTIAPFIVERSYEQIKLDLCYQKLGANIITVGSAFDYSTLGCTHHCYVDFALLKPLPDTQIFFPSSPIELNTLFKQTYDNEKLSYFRVPKLSHDFIFSQDQIITGKGLIIKPGKDVTIVVIGPQLKTVLDAYNRLKDKGVEAEVIYIHTIKPFDYELILKSIKKTKKVLVIEEHSMYGGIGDEILRIAKDIGGVRYSFISIPDIFIREYGSYEDICEILGFTAKNIINKVKTELF
jgi:transketolase